MHFPYFHYILPVNLGCVIVGVMATAVFIIGPLHTLLSAERASIYDDVGARCEWHRFTVSTVADFRVSLPSWLIHVCVSSHVYLLSERPVLYSFLRGHFSFLCIIFWSPWVVWILCRSYLLSSVLISCGWGSNELPSTIFVHVILQWMRNSHYSRVNLSTNWDIRVTRRLIDIRIQLWQNSNFNVCRRSIEVHDPTIRIYVVQWIMPCPRLLAHVKLSIYLKPL